MAFDENYMIEAIAQAKLALLCGDAPIGAVITHQNKLVSVGYNKREKHQNSLYHAEIIAIDEACKALGTWRLIECDLYVTLEPCPMCAGAIMQARMRNVYFGAFDKKAGALCSTMSMYDVPGFNHYPSIYGGILEETCSAFLKEFFSILR